MGLIGNEVDTVAALQYVQLHNPRCGKMCRLVVRVEEPELCHSVPDHSDSATFAKPPQYISVELLTT